MSDTIRQRRPLILAAVMAAMMMIAIEATIVATAMKSIVGQLGNPELFSWVFASFLLTQTATTVVFGKLADVYGRKPTLLVGIAVFLVGSVLCGFAWSLPALIVFRLIQGIGAGAIQPIGITVVGDMYSLEERGKIQGYLASVWGISSVLGPVAGGFIVGNVSWAWVFWINVPIGLLSAGMFMAFLHEDIARNRRKVDVAGAALFAVAVAALMVALTEAGTSNLATALAASGVFVVSSVLFVFQERRAADPMMAFGLWAHRPIATANAATLLSGIAMIGLTAFLPLYVQGVLNRSATVAGYALAMMVLGWPVGATLAAKNLMRFGLRRTLLLGAAIIPVGAIPIVLLNPSSSPVLAGVGSIVIGLGMGFLSTGSIVLIQESVGWAERGAATASNIFSRNLGNTLGAVVLGAVLNYSLARGGNGAVPVSSDQLRQLLDRPDGVTAVDNPAVQAALGQALHVTFWAVFVVSLLTLAFATLVPSVATGRGPRGVMAE